MRLARFPVLLWLVPVLVIAAILRFYALTQRGLVYWDEGKFALEGIRFLAIGQALTHGHGSIIAGKAVGTAKPSHAVLIAASYAIFGVQDYAPLLMDAALSVVQVGLVYVLARRLFGDVTALVAAAFLAVSEYDIVFARSALSESDANVLLIAAAIIWAFGWRLNDREARWSASSQRLLAAGLVLGAAFTVNYRMIVYAGVLVAFDLVWSAYRSGFRSTVLRVPAWSAGLVLPPFAWQAVDIFARTHGVVLFRHELTGTRTSYLAEAVYQLHQGKQSRLNFQPLQYLHWIAGQEGLPLLLLLGAGLVLAARYRSFPWLFPAVMVVVPYGVYTFAPFIVARNLAAAIPFLCLLAAAALVWLIHVVRERVLATALLAAAVLALCASLVVQSWQLTADASGWVKAADYVQQHHGRAAASSEVAVFYLRGKGTRCDAIKLTHDVRRLSADLRGGFSYVLLDHTSTRVDRLIAGRMPLVASFFAVDSDPDSEPLDYVIPKPHQVPVRVNVYRLSASVLGPSNLHPDICNREVVMPH